MAGNAGLVPGLRHGQQDDVVVAVNTHLVHGLHMAGLFALEPQLFARARKVHGAAQLCRFLQRLAVHPREHQYMTCALLLRDDGDQTFVVPLDLIEPIHGNSFVRGCLRLFDSKFSNKTR